MVVLTKIYTKTGDDGTTGLGSGERRKKFDLRVEAYGTVDETNAAIGMARLSTGADPALADLDAMLMRIQNDLFDLGADLSTPPTEEDLGYEPLRVVPSQVERLESEIDTLNADLSPLNSFVLPGGTPAAAALHVARTVSRRAERLSVELADQEPGMVSDAVRRYLNRLSDFLFVAARWTNDKGAADVLWVPGKNR
ncbi:MAG: cob(I)yrinic acid a,c-diamide adenosyltransferase [Rhizobiales bacterium]|nr:cob(I)yrinic acid a,c-diamide adenosyltransferase [Hyphomicrobiales bacterium]MBO6699726.1 cob(I)yrinic acid a,c-diamide adenosyltransferase [Hyphomicrobiales bacterium]MBO6737264.1 cob(I)yrinic acid a,c-diamide adenosyltransferase [Hyphomicrobiales bacterium]MBO6911662.1 cob(I)yrinic acid a,c-diamide adenosyltransferase [Hyphomicrobiales bacterium]MBO6954916.1 cob(I)yrinic acid a,c-diamide adenosyltransferase [Hyphomicrobiales bacterium]